MRKSRIRIFILYPLLLCVIVCLIPLGAGAVSTSLTTLFAGNVTFQGNMFNVTVSPGIDIVITAFDINLLSAEGSVPIIIYYREGGYQGYETNGSAWTLLQSSFVTSGGINTPTSLPLNSGLPLSAGKTYGFYISINGDHNLSEILYTYSAQEYSDARISISTAASLSWPLFTDPHFPRTWNGTIYYDYEPTPTPSPTPAPTPDPTPTPTPAPDPPDTGDASTPLLWLGIALVALAGGSALGMMRRRRRN